jgi:hypothetical protein
MTKLLPQKRLENVHGRPIRENGMQNKPPETTDGNNLRKIVPRR